jgi:hypothetical protein
VARARVQRMRSFFIKVYSIHTSGGHFPKSACTDQSVAFIDYNNQSI